jgi:hypothetical protein
LVPVSDPIGQQTSTLGSVANSAECRVRYIHRPGSVEASALDELRRERAQDRQVFAYRLGKHLDRSRARPIVFMLENNAAVQLSPESLSRLSYLSALNSSVRRLILEAAPPMIHKSYTTTAIVIAARMRLTNDTCQNPTK